MPIANTGLAGNPSDDTWGRASVPLWQLVAVVATDGAARLTEHGRDWSSKFRCNMESDVTQATLVL